MKSGANNSVTLTGIGAAPGIANGRAVLFDRRGVTVPKIHINTEDVEKEIERFSAAVEQSIKDLKALEETVSTTFDGEHVEILEAHELMLRDDLLIKGTEKHIRSNEINAEWALVRALREIKEFFNNLEDDFFRERRSDVEYVGDRILRNLTGQSDEKLQELVIGLDEPTILVAYDLSPAETIQLRHTNVVGICTAEGTKTAHSAIVARCMGLVTVVGIADITDTVGVGDQLLIDGDLGTVCVRPTAPQRETIQKRHDKLSAVRSRLSRKGNTDTSTVDGFSVQLSGNIDLLDEIESVKENGGKGVGLYRTEFLFLNRRTLPSEEEQYDSYRKLVEACAPDSATIRTLDIGGDKLEIPGGTAEKLNPFFGRRAIRYCLKEKTMFLTQLRALLRAGNHGDLRILIPFVTDVSEIEEVKILLDEARDQLTRQGLGYNPNTQLGAMIEIPSAALIADILARHVDFFSVGTNDLIQYTLAIARDTTEIGYLYHPLHPAVLRVLKIVSDAAHQEGIRLSMCGEMAGEALYAAVLLGFRFDELSMSPSSIPIIREIVQRSRLKDVRKMLDGLYRHSTYQEVEAAVSEYMNGMFPDLAPLLGGELSRA